MKKFFTKWARLYQRSAAPGAARQTRAPTSALYGGMGERELELRMDLILGEFPNKRQYTVSRPAKQLAAFSLSEQERFLKAVERLSRRNVQLAYRFCSDGIAALTSVRGDEWDRWLELLEQELRNNGEDAAFKYLQNLEAQLRSIMPPHSVALKDIAPVIERLLTALGGRRLTVHAAAETYTDTERIHLPERCAHFPHSEQNFSWYKATAVFLWAQIRFGTWRVDIRRLLYDAPDTDKAVRLFQALESLRLEACIGRELPGVDRILAQLGGQAERLPDTEAWRQAARQLAQSEATAEDSLKMISAMYRAPLPETAAYQGVFKPAVVLRTMNQRIATEQAALEEELSKLSAKLGTTGGSSKLILNVDRGNADVYNFRLSKDGEAVEISPELEPLLASVMQDLGEVPEDYLRADGDGGKKDQLGKAEKNGAAMLLPEWDHSIRQYRRDWCHIFVRDIVAGDVHFAQQILTRHNGLVKQLRRTFEALREGHQRHKREPCGDDIDLDAAVEAFVSSRRGEEPDAGTYIRHHKTARDIAVVFIADMSGSTGGWINETEKAALVLLCESLETLGDRYAIYGFSGDTRKQCDIFRIKSFDEPYGARVQKNIDGITPQNYTRLGAAIRFVRTQLLNVDARTRLMVTISDGRPDDRDGYRSQYGIEDTRCALLETGFRGIHTHCITIDTEAADYLPYMYGGSHFSIVDRIEKLPFQVSDIYRRITS